MIVALANAGRSHPDKEIVGFEVLLEGLTAEESLTVQKWAWRWPDTWGAGYLRRPVTQVHHDN